MSVNGDSCVLRNGKASSKVSIYEYPEHLNPFYEDENHKRLRFWKIGKSAGESGRRGSFSLAGMKEMWTLKTFRLRKKSSSLGINKTSESPPELRRNFETPSANANYGTYDPRMRHTTGSNFDRNVPYRSSLQDMRAVQTLDRSNGFGFGRNDRYRSTIQTPAAARGQLSPQVPSRRYVYGGSVTPQPARSNGYNEEVMLSRGSSQISVASSTNPFEDDDDDKDVVIHRLSTSSTPSKRPARKKRRAPPPPVASHQIIREESFSNPSSPSSNNRLRIEEDEDDKTANDRVAIANLTAEIESFVKDSNHIEDNNDKGKKEQQTESSHKTVTETMVVTVNQEKREAPPELTREVTIELHESEIPKTIAETLQENERRGSLKVVENGQPTDETENEEANNLQITSEAVKRIEKEVLEASPRKIEKEEKKINSEISFEIETKIQNDVPNTPVGTPTQLTPPLELKISESKEDVSEISDVSEASGMDKASSTLTIEYLPLKESSPEIEQQPLLAKPVISPKPQLEKRFDDEIKPKPSPPPRDFSTKLTFDQSTPIPNPPRPTERRRSVRDIIASINHSQSLLKVNKDQNNLDQPKAIERQQDLASNYKTLADGESEIRRMLEELHTPSSSAFDDRVKSDEEQLNGILDDLADTLNNNMNNNSMDTFKKCMTKTELSKSRESSPTTSNLDWNPVPKPKRTKNISPELKLSNAK